MTILGNDVTNLYDYLALRCVIRDRIELSMLNLVDADVVGSCNLNHCGVLGRTAFERPEGFVDDRGV